MRSNSTGRESSFRALVDEVSGGGAENVVYVMPARGYCLGSASVIAAGIGSSSLCLQSCRDGPRVHRVDLAS